MLTVVMPLIAAASTATSAPLATASAPGLTMISTPMKPAAAADHLRMRTISPRNSTAPIVTNSGEEYESAIAWASGRCTIAQKPAIMPSMPITQRAT